MCRRSSRKWTVMPSAPPSRASTAAATGSGSSARRACRTVATWSMFTPRRTGLDGVVMRTLYAPARSPVAVNARQQLVVALHLAGQDLVDHYGQDDQNGPVQDAAHEGDVVDDQVRKNHDDDGREEDDAG